MKCRFCNGWGFVYSGNNTGSYMTKKKCPLCVEGIRK